MTKPIEHVGFFFESRIPVYLLNGHYYAANGWNGEEYLDSWECADFKYDTGYGVKPGTDCTLRPSTHGRLTASTWTASTRHPKNLRMLFKLSASILFNALNHKTPPGLWAAFF